MVKDERISKYFTKKTKKLTKKKDFENLCRILILEGDNYGLR